jgi:hypothetical protein
MSNLVKLINARRGSEHKAILSPINSICSIDDGYVDVEYGVQYSIGVKFGSSVFVDEGANYRDAFTLVNAVGQVKRSVVEAVFGEFRQDFRDIEQLIYSHNFSAVAKRLRQFEQKMFDDS